MTDNDRFVSQEVDLVKAQFDHYLAHQEEFVALYNGKHLVFSEMAVKGAFETWEESCSFAEANFERGTFMLQKCSPGKKDYTVRFIAKKFIRPIRLASTQKFDATALDAIIAVTISSDHHAHYSCKAIWDRSVWRTRINHRLVDLLQLEMLDPTEIPWIRERENPPFYKVSVGFSRKLNFNGLHVAYTEEFDGDHDVVLGRDIICQLDFGIEDTDRNSGFFLQFKGPSVPPIQ